jgi:hypothetical protein
MTRTTDIERADAGWSFAIADDDDGEARRLNVGLGRPLHASAVTPDACDVRSVIVRQLVDELLSASTIADIRARKAQRNVFLAPSISSRPIGAAMAVSS